MADSMKKYFALSLILIFGFVILFYLKVYLTPIFAAIIITFLTYPIYNFILKKVKSEVASATIVIILVLLTIFIPLSTIAGIFISNIASFDFNDSLILDFEQKIENLTNTEFKIANSLTDLKIELKKNLKNYAKTFVSFGSNFLLSMVIMFFIMFYFLIERKKVLEEVYLLLPFSNKNSKLLVSETANMTKAILIGQVLTAVIQGTLGMISFFIAGIDGAFFWGIIMIILSLIPMIGAFLVWLPAGVILLINGEVGMGIFILVWGGLVVSQVDNFVRPKLVNKFANIHPLETFLGIFVGLAAFGMIGIIIGPLMLSIFKVLVQTYRKEYTLENSKSN